MSHTCRITPGIIPPWLVVCSYTKIEEMTVWQSQATAINHERFSWFDQQTKDMKVKVWRVFLRVWMDLLIYLYKHHCFQAMLSVQQRPSNPVFIIKDFIIFESPSSHKLMRRVGEVSSLWFVTLSLWFHLLDFSVSPDVWRSTGKNSQQQAGTAVFATWQFSEKAAIFTAGKFNSTNSALKKRTAGARNGERFESKDFDLQQCDCSNSERPAWPDCF